MTFLFGMEKNETTDSSLWPSGFCPLLLTSAMSKRNMFSEPIFENTHTTNFFKTVKSLCWANFDGKETPAWVPGGTPGSSAAHLVTHLWGESCSAGICAEDPAYSLASAVGLFTFPQAKALCCHLFTRLCQLIVAEYYQPGRVRQVMEGWLYLNQ